MKVHIKVTDWFKRYTGGKADFELDMEEGSCAADALAKTGIPESEIGFVSIDNQKGSAECKLVDMQSKLADGDSLRVYPLIIGG